MRLSIGQPAADCTFDRPFGALGIINAKGDPVGIPEIILAQITRQMLFGTVLVNPDHAALEDAEIAFNGVGRDLLPAPSFANVFFGSMIDGFVFGELAARCHVSIEFVGMQRALARGIGDENGPQSGAGQIVDLDGTGTPAALDQGHDLHLLAALGAYPAVVVDENPFGWLSRADECLVSLDNLALAAERPVAIGAAFHSLANAVRHEPSRAIRAEAESP